VIQLRSGRRSPRRSVLGLSSIGPSTRTAAFNALSTSSVSELQAELLDTAAYAFILHARIESIGAELQALFSRDPSFTIGERSPHQPAPRTRFGYWSPLRLVVRDESRSAGRYGGIGP
jgi:hypothetical protein